MKLSVFLPVSMLSALALSALLPGEAQAAPKLGIDVNFALPVSMNSASAGAGGAIRGGYELNLAILHVTPEIGLGYDKLTSSGGPGIFRGFAGGRLGVGGGVRLEGFAHLGYASVSYSGAGATGMPVVDGGLALDFTLLPVVDFGIHAAYNVALDSSSVASKPTWLGLGLHIAFVF